MCNVKNFQLDFPLYYFLVDEQGNPTIEQPGLRREYLEIPSVPVEELFLPIANTGECHVGRL